MKNIVKDLEKNNVLLDTNILLRYLIKDDLDLYNKAKYIIQNNNCYVLTSVLQECIFVLEGKIYKINRKEIVDSIRETYSHIFYNDKEIIDQTLEIYKNNPKLDFVDCLLYTYSLMFKIDLYRFDKELNKLIYIS